MPKEPDYVRLTRLADRLMDDPFVKLPDVVSIEDSLRLDYDDEVIDEVLEFIHRLGVNVEREQDAKD